MSTAMDITGETNTVEETTEVDMVEESQTETAELTLEEIEANKTLVALEALPDLVEKLALDNTQYEVHVKLIETLKQVDLADELEKARREMHKVYPLSEGLWLDWINNAKKEASTEEGREKLLELYSTAQEDYLSIEIWKSYVKYILEKFHEQFDDESITTETEQVTELVEDTRTNLLKAVAAITYHIKKSQEIWKPYSEFELVVLNKFKSPEQLERVKNMFLERLKVLHIDCEDTFSAYSSFVTTWDNANYEQNLSETNKIYAKTKKAAEERDFFEMKLVSNGYTLDSFYEYIENEKITKLMPSVNNVRCLYERAIVYYCTDPTLWDDYIFYLIEKARVNAFLENVCIRAIRNCPWSGTLYAHRARLLESENQDNDQIDSVFDAALSSKQLLSSLEDLVTVLLAKIDCNRRKIDWEDPDGDDLVNLQVAFIEAIEYLNEAFPQSGDPYYRIEKYYAFISAKRLGDPDKARELWDSVIERNGLDEEAWIQYITFERDQGNYQKCESLFKQAIQKALYNPARLIDVWNTMEREFGTLESYEQAMVRINRKIKGLSRKWQASLALQEEKNEAREKEKKETEKRKKGIHRMEQKKKQKEKNAASSDFKKPREFNKDAQFKKPDFRKPFTPKGPSGSSEFKKPLPFVKPAHTEPTDTKEHDDEGKDKDGYEPSASLKRKLSDVDMREDEAKKHKVDQPVLAAPIKPFRPQPRATRGREGKKYLALGATRAIIKTNTVEQQQASSSETVTPQEGESKSNDDFRNLLLGKK